MVQHGRGCRVAVVGHHGVHDFLVLLKRGPDLAQRAKRVAAVITGARAHPQHLLAQIGIAGAAVNQFMKAQVAFLPACEVVGVCHCPAFFVMLKDVPAFLARHALARQAHSNTFQFGQ